MVSDVVQALRRRGAHFEILHHARAVDGLEESIALGLAPGDVLKSVVIESRGAPVLAVVTANRRLDMHLVRGALADPHARLASEDEIEHELPGCELGGVPALGSVLRTPVYVDPEVLSHPVVAFAAGTQTESVKGPTDELFLGEFVTVTPIAASPRDGG
jgi:prolyl-tRNA editing enzyme YbaK/EbsC (Cys-tRNA(Pro) deacylase)